MDTRLLRAAYGIEFFIVIMASFDFWSQVGGQSHLDLMPWWWKFGFSAAFAGSIVKLSAAVSRRGALIWLFTALLIVLGAGMITYWYHLNEPIDKGDEETKFTAKLSWRAPVVSCNKTVPSSCIAPRPV